MALILFHSRWFGTPSHDTIASRLRYEVLTKEVVDYLGRSLPNVTTLQVMQTRISSTTVEQVIALIGKWEHQLTGLKLGARYRESRKLTSDQSDELIARNLATLLTAVNQLPSLKCLALQLHHRVVPMPPAFVKASACRPLDLSILARLEQVSSLIMSLGVVHI